MLGPDALKGQSILCSVIACFEILQIIIGV